MQQRRPHSAVATGDGDSSREQRRLERKLARGKLRRVKRRDKHGSPSSWDPRRYPYVQMALLSFAMFSLIGVTVVRMFHRGDSQGGRRGSARPPQAGEYNSDRVDSGLLGQLRGGKYRIPEAMKGIGNRRKWYTELRRKVSSKVTNDAFQKAVLACFGLSSLPESAVSPNLVDHVVVLFPVDLFLE